MSDSSLWQVLELDAVGEDRYVGINPDSRRTRVFGGQVAAQALRAAALTVGEDRHPNSMHSYFIRPGAPARSISYEVQRIGDGRSFTARQVLARQGEGVILSLSASFHTDEPGFDYQPQRDMSQLPRPGDLEPSPGPDRFTDVREIPLGPDNHHGAGHRLLWIRTIGYLPDRADLHACALTYVTDRGPMGSVRKSLTGDPQQTTSLMNATLDHSLWFHRPARATSWHLYELMTRSAGGARALAQGVVRDQTGAVVATVSQEVLIRPTSKGIREP